MRAIRFLILLPFKFAIRVLFVFGMIPLLPIMVLAFFADGMFGGWHWLDCIVFAYDRFLDKLWTASEIDMD